jgi:predicted secreted protein
MIKGVCGDVHPFLALESAMKKILIAVFLLFSAAGVAGAEPPLPGTLVSIQAVGEVKADNDEAHATFFIEEQDKDKGAAASRVNQKMKLGMDALKKEDPQAVLTSRGYYTYPMYIEDRTQSASASHKRQLTGWRVGQYLEMKTGNLQKLPGTVAAAQNILALSGMTFGLSDLTNKRLDAGRIEAAYLHLMARVRVIAKAMGRRDVDAVIESIDFDGSENIGRPYAATTMLAKSARMDEPVAEASFEPGSSTLTMRVVARVRFK